MRTKRLLNGIHATLVVIDHQGILLVGPSGSGKSRFALHQLQQGHQLVSDDLVLLKQEDERLIGCAPTEGLGWLHDKKQGLINIVDRFGQQALCTEHAIDCVYCFDPTYLAAAYEINGVVLPCHLGDIATQPRKNMECSGKSRSSPLL